MLLKGIKSVLFRPPDTVLSSSVLDGYRSILCIWMLLFHSLFFSFSYIPVSNYESYTSSYYLGIINSGYFAVDGFFVLTGFLLTFPLFKEDKNKINNNLIKLNEYNNNYSIGMFWYRRFTRMLPSYILMLFLHCIILFPDIAIKYSILRNEGLLWLLNYSYNNNNNQTLSILTDTTPIPPSPSLYCKSNCQQIPLNFLQINNLAPFGGTSGTSWSFAVQFQFYVWIPILWKFSLILSKYFSKTKNNNTTQTSSSSTTKNINNNTNNNNKNNASSSTSSDSSSSSSSPLSHNPSYYFIIMCLLLLLFSFICRFLAFFSLRSIVIEHPIGMFCAFFWYSSGLVRMTSILFGILAAYLCVNLSNPIKKNIIINYSTILYLLCFLFFIIQVYWNIQYNGRIAEQPGDSAVRISSTIHNRTILELENISLNTIYNDNLLHYTQRNYYDKKYFIEPCFSLFNNPLKMFDGFAYFWKEFFYYVFIQVGSIGSSIMFTTVLFLLFNSNYLYESNNSNLIPKFLSSFLCHPIHYPISVLSLWIYLVHPNYLNTFYNIYSEYYPNWELNNYTYFIILFCMFSIVLSTSSLFYIFFESPIDSYLRENPNVNRNNIQINQISSKEKEKLLEKNNNKINNGNGNGNMNSNSNQKSDIKNSLIYKICFYYGILLMIIGPISNLLGSFVVLTLDKPEGVDFLYHRPIYSNTFKYLN